MPAMQEWPLIVSHTPAVLSRSSPSASCGSRSSLSSSSDHISDRRASALPAYLDVKLFAAPAIGRRHRRAADEFFGYDLAEHFSSFSVT